MIRPEALVSGTFALADRLSRLHTAIPLLASPRIAWIETTGLEAGIPSSGIAPGFSLVCWLLTAADQRLGPLRRGRGARPYLSENVSPGSVVETILHESQVIFRITRVMRSPMSGSARSTPSDTSRALATTPRETYPSVRA